MINRHTMIAVIGHQCFLTGRFHKLVYPSAVLDVPTGENPV